MNKQTDKVYNLHEYFIKMKTNLLKCISSIYLFKALTHKAKGNVKKKISTDSFTSLGALM